MACVPTDGRVMVGCCEAGAFTVRRFATGRTEEVGFSWGGGPDEPSYEGAVGIVNAKVGQFVGELNGLDLFEGATATTVGRYEFRGFGFVKCVATAKICRDSFRGGYAFADVWRMGFMLSRSVPHCLTEVLVSFDNSKPGPPFVYPCESGWPEAVSDVTTRVLNTPLRFAPTVPSPGAMPDGPHGYDRHHGAYLSVAFAPNGEAC